MDYIEQNKKAWGQISEEHYNHFKMQYENGEYNFNPIIEEELGDITGKTILHLQCNTGADSIALAKLGAKHVTGVDLVPDNIAYATQLADDLGVDNVNFIACDIMKLLDEHEGEYDIVFTSDGAIGWLPDLNRWAGTIAHYLKKDGYFYAHDSHPFYLTFDEDGLQKGEANLRYPYFDKEPDEGDSIGGYAGESHESKTYFWMYSVGELINVLSGAGLFIEYFNEHNRCAHGMGGNIVDEKGLRYIKELENSLPITFSIKASIR